MHLGLWQVRTGMRVVGSSRGRDATISWCGVWQEATCQMLCSAFPWQSLRPFGSCFALANALEFIALWVGSNSVILNLLRSLQSADSILWGPSVLQLTVKCRTLLLYGTLMNFMSSVKSNGSLEDVSPFGSNTAIFGSARGVYHSEVLNARVI